MTGRVINGNDSSNAFVCWSKKHDGRAVGLGFITSKRQQQQVAALPLLHRTMQFPPFCSFSLRVVKQGGKIYTYTQQLPTKNNQPKKRKKKKTKGKYNNH